MPRLNRRTRVISIRLSDEEYEQLRDLCLSKGVDTISDLARSAMKHLIAREKGLESPVFATSVSEVARAALQQILSNHSGSLVLDDQVRGLRDQVHNLSIEVGRIAQRMAQQA